MIGAPAQTQVTRDGYDPADFRPYLTAIPVRDGTEVKGAVVLLAGGAFQARANYTDTLPTAAHLRELGFQTFIVDYRPAGRCAGCGTSSTFYPKKRGCLRYRPE